MLILTITWTMDSLDVDDFVTRFGAHVRRRLPDFQTVSFKRHVEVLVMMFMGLMSKAYMDIIIISNWTYFFCFSSK